MSLHPSNLGTRSFVAFAVATGLAAPRAARAENHFLAEVNGGIATPLGSEGDIDVGPGLGLTLGVGGRIKGLTPAWYLVGRLGHTQSTEIGPDRFGAAELERGAWEAAIGGRAYFNLTERLRLVTELAFGEIWETSTITRGHQPELELEANPAALFVQLGLQYRITDHVSVGGGADLGYHLAGTGRADLGATAAGLDAREESRGRVRFGLTATAHF